MYNKEHVTEDDFIIVMFWKIRCQTNGIETNFNDMVVLYINPVFLHQTFSIFIMIWAYIHK